MTPGRRASFSSGRITGIPPAKIAPAGPSPATRSRRNPRTDKMDFANHLLIIAGLLLLGGVGLLFVAARSQRVRWEPIAPDATPARELSPGQWSSLASKRIFFAHMSVGRDLLDGLEDLQKEADGPRLVVREMSEPGALTRPAVGHALLGHNGEPLRKIDAFRQLLGSRQLAPPDVAFMKLCYVDVRHDTSVPSLFEAYTTAMTELRARLPSTRVVHLTVPLCSPSTGWISSAKAGVKRWLGRADVTADNLRREEFNQRLREAYEADGSLIDIAAAESTTPRGRSVVERGGRLVRCLAPDYTSDGGHLNAVGRRHVSRVLVARLAEIASGARPTTGQASAAKGIH